MKPHAITSDAVVMATVLSVHNSASTHAVTNPETIVLAATALAVISHVATVLAVVRPSVMVHGLSAKMVLRLLSMA